MSTMEHNNVRYIRVGESKLVKWEGVVCLNEIMRLLDLPMDGSTRIVAVGDNGAVEFRHLAIHWWEKQPAGSDSGGPV